MKSLSRLSLQKHLIRQSASNPIKSYEENFAYVIHLCNRHFKCRIRKMTFCDVLGITENNWECWEMAVSTPLVSMKLVQKQFFLWSLDLDSWRHWYNNRLLHKSETDVVYQTTNIHTAYWQVIFNLCAGSSLYFR